MLTRRFALAIALSTTVAPGLVRAQADLKTPADDVRPTPDVPPSLRALSTYPWRHDRLSYNWTTISTTPLPKDREGIWVLDFAFKPLRIQTVEVPGKGRRTVHYLYYKVVNRTSTPRPFYPQFIMVNERGQRFEDAVIPEAIPVINGREDVSIPVHGAVDIMGAIPPSTKQGVDDAVMGVAVWDQWDAHADRFSIYVRGLSDGYKEVTTPEGPKAKYKTLKLDFIRRGDHLNLNEKEIEPANPPYEWVYW